MSYIDPRLESIDSALSTAYHRVRELDKHRPAEGGRLLPPDVKAADLYSHAATLAEALATDLRGAEDAFRPVPGLDQDPGGGS